jgi:hypothetical protein
MPSAALNKWHSVRVSRITRLRRAHTAYLRTAYGRRTGAEEINHSLVLHLASEFQGFARDLHNEGVAAVVAQLAPADPSRQKVLRIPYVITRKLDRGNATPSVLESDFGLLGFHLWTALSDHDASAGIWLKNLEALNRARNGVAHSDDAKIVAVVRSGWPLTLASIDVWQNSLDALAGALDNVLGRYLKNLLGKHVW